MQAIKADSPMKSESEVGQTCEIRENEVSDEYENGDSLEANRTDEEDLERSV